jgi:hypothetical protein
VAGQAWLVAGQLEEEEAEASPVVCYTFAALYAAPLLHNGIALDVTDALMLALGVIHLQVLHLAAHTSITSHLCF